MEASEISRLTRKEIEQKCLELQRLGLLRPRVNRETGKREWTATAAGKWMQGRKYPRNSKFKEAG